MASLAHTEACLVSCKSNIYLKIIYNFGYANVTFYLINCFVKCKSRVTQYHFNAGINFSCIENCFKLINIHSSNTYHNISQCIEMNSAVLFKFHLVSHIGKYLRPPDFTFIFMTLFAFPDMLHMVTLSKYSQLFLVY